jgi:hypothetical protein
MRVEEAPAPERLSALAGACGWTPVDMKRW